MKYSIHILKYPHKLLNILTSQLFKVRFLSVRATERSRELCVSSVRVTNGNRELCALSLLDASLCSLLEVTISPSGRVYLFFSQYYIQTFCHFDWAQRLRNLDSFCIFSMRRFAPYSKWRFSCQFEFIYVSRWPPINSRNFLNCGSFCLSLFFSILNTHYSILI